MQTVNACVIPEIVARFSSAHAGIRVTCTEMSVADIESGIEGGRLDLGISFLPATRQLLDGETLFTEELVAVVPKKHRLARRATLAVSELAEWPLVLLSNQYCTRQLIDAAFRQARAQANVQIEMNSIDSILATVREARLLSVIPSLALCRRDRGLMAIPLVDPTPARSVGLLWLRGAQRRGAAQAFARVTAQVLAERRMNVFS
jgi:LysR family cyn operon transcriptional activator